MKNLQLQASFVAACRSGSLEEIRRLRNSGADPCHADSQGFLPCVEAAFQGHHEVVSQLLAWGCDPTQATRHTGDTATHVAAAGNFEDVLTCLLDHGADLEKKNVRGNTPLHCAAGEGKAAAVTVCHLA